MGLSSSQMARLLQHSRENLPAVLSLILALAASMLVAVEDP